MSKTHFISIYLPSKDKTGALLPIPLQAELYQSLVLAMTDFFGGATSVQGVGLYKNPSSTIEKEDVLILTSYMTETEMDSYLETLKLMIAESCVMLSQESMMYVVDNIAFFTKGEPS